jgi:hypothetical protein
MCVKMYRIFRNWESRSLHLDQKRPYWLLRKQMENYDCIHATVAINRYTTIQDDEWALPMN